MNATFDLAKGTATFETNHFSTFVISVDESAGVTYRTNVMNLAWLPYVKDGAEAGTDHQYLMAEAVQIKLTGHLPKDASIIYQAHVMTLGWLSPVSDGQIAGTTGQNRRMEAIKITLFGLPGYKVEYRAHVKHLGWLPWQATTNGKDISKAAVAGTTGQARRLEAIEVRIVKTGS